MSVVFPKGRKGGTEMVSVRKLALFAILMLAALLALVACGGAPAAPATQPPAATSAPAPTSAPSAAKVLKVGVAGPYTGPAALTGAEFKGAVQMAFDNVNYQVGDYKIQ